MKYKLDCSEFKTIEMSFRKGENFYLKDSSIGLLKRILSDCVIDKKYDLTENQILEINNEITSRLESIGETVNASKKRNMSNKRHPLRETYVKHGAVGTYALMALR